MIRRAGERALAAGMRTARCLEVLAETRARIDVPLIPMTYSSIFDAYGWEQLESDAQAAGATSLIVADLPSDVRPELPPGAHGRADLDGRATEARSRQHRRLALSRHGNRDDGSACDLAPTLAPLAERARAVTDVPLYAGFGISTADHARAAGESSSTASPSARRRSRWPRRGSAVARRA